MGCVNSTQNGGGSSNNGTTVSRNKGKRSPSSDENPLVVGPNHSGGGRGADGGGSSSTHHPDDQLTPTDGGAVTSNSSSPSAALESPTAGGCAKKRSSADPQNEDELEDISSDDEDDDIGGPVAAPTRPVGPRGGVRNVLTTTGSVGGDDTSETPTIIQLNKPRPLTGLPLTAGGGDDDPPGTITTTSSGPIRTTAELIPKPGQLLTTTDGSSGKDAIYIAMGVDNSTALVTYNIYVPGASNGIGKVPNADDFDDVSMERWIAHRIEARKKERAEQERRKRGGLDFAPLKIGSSDTSSSALSTPLSSGPVTPMMPPTPHRVKKPKMANLEPFLRNIEVSMMSNAAIPSKGKRIKVLVVSQDEKELAWCSCEDSTLYMANIPHNQAVGQFIGHSDRILGAALAPVGVSYYVATASVDRFCIVWDRNKGQLTDAKVVLAHTQTVVCVNFSHDYKYLVTACQDKGARIYNSRNGECVVVYKGHSEVVFHCGFSPDDQFVSSCSFDLSVHMWSSKNGRPRFVFRGHAKIPMMSSFTPDGKRLISNDDKEVRVWDIRGNKGCVRIFKVTEVVPQPPPPAEGSGGKAKVYGWTFCSVAPGPLLGTNHFVVGCTNGVVYIYNMNHGLPGFNGGSAILSGGSTSSSRSPDSTGAGWSRLSTVESQMSNSSMAASSNPSIHSRQSSVVVAGLTQEGHVYSQADEEACMYATRGAEVWSHHCRGAVYAIHCGPTSTIACGDLLGNVYILRLDAGQ